MRRFLSVFLCLFLLFSFFLSPIRAYAVVDPAYSSAYVVVGDIVVEGFKEGAKVISSALASVWNKVFTYDLLQTAQGVLEVGSWDSSSAVFRSYSDGELSAGQVVLTKAFLSSVAAAYKTKTGLTLSTPSDDVTIYVPPESVWTEAELITADRLNTKGFADLTEVNQNILAGNQIAWQLKKDLNGLELYLRTDFINNISSHFSDLKSSLSSSISAMNSNLASKLSTINSSLSSVITSIDAMSSTLHKDISDLKSVYSSFGNATLDKLDTLNTSIQNIDINATLSADFVDLRETITFYGSNIYNSIDALPDQISNSLAAYFDTQANQLESISNKLGQESSYLADLIGEIQLIRDNISDGFADVIVALDSLDVDVAIDFQPVVDQIQSSEFILDDSLDSLASVLDVEIAGLISSIEALSASNNELLTSIECLLVDGWNELFLEYSSLYYNQLEDLNYRLYELTYEALADYFEDTLSTFVEKISENSVQVEQGLSTVRSEVEFCWMTLEDSIENIADFIKNDVVGELQGIKTTIDRLVPESVVVSKPAVDVQVGAQTIVVTDYASAGTAFHAKLGWIGELFNFLKELFERITYTGEAPKVSLNLSDSEGSYDLGVDTLMIDLSWYTRFKPTVDLLLSGILWITFCMHAYRRTPDILSGVGASDGSTDEGYKLFGIRKPKER